MMRQAGRYGTIGLEMGFAFAICIYLGHKLDSWLGWAPWGTLGGFFVALAAVIKLLANVVREFQRHQASEQQSESKEPERDLQQGPPPPPTSRPAKPKTRWRS